MGKQRMGILKNTGDGLEGSMVDRSPLKVEGDGRRGKKKKNMRGKKTVMAGQGNGIVVYLQASGPKETGEESIKTCFPGSKKSCWGIKGR